MAGSNGEATSATSGSLRSAARVYCTRSLVPTAEEVGFGGEARHTEGGRRDLHHTAQGGNSMGDALGGQLGGALQHQRFRPAELAEAADHREHDADVPVLGRPQEGAHLLADELGPSAHEPHRAKPHRGVRTPSEPLTGRELVPTEVEGTEHHRRGLHGLGHSPVHGQLRFLVGHGAAMQEQELGPVQAPPRALHG